MSHADSRQVVWYGFGAHVGDFPRPGWDHGERQEYEAILAVSHPTLTIDEADRLLHRLSLNPKIELDSGGVVWGFQCWWSEAEGWESFLADREPILIPAPDPGTPN